MGCYDCICEKRDWRSGVGEYCQLSTYDTFIYGDDDGWESYKGNCSFYNSDRKCFIDHVLKVNKHKGNDFDFSILNIEEYSPCSKYISTKNLYIKDFWDLLKRQDFWENDKDFFKKIRNKKIEYIEFYGNGKVGLQLCEYDVIDNIQITKDDSEKFELLEMLSSRNDGMKLKDILMYME